MLAHGHVDADGAPVIWNIDSDSPEDNQVAGHQVIWEKEIVLPETNENSIDNAVTALH